jgi:RNA polymerase sigma-70 factor (ECF subfamily)
MIRYQQLTEVEIINKILAGEGSAFEVLIRRYNPTLYKIGCSYGYIHQDVEDLMQDAFINAYRNLDKLEHKLYFKTWLTRIMLNECYRKSHKISFRNESVIDISLYIKTVSMYSNNNDTENTVVNRELNRAIEKAIKQIPLDYRLVFSLRELNNMSVVETANALSISETNVKVRLNRAKAMLRKQIEKMYTPEEIFEFNLIYCDAIVARVMQQIEKRVVKEV